MLRNPRFRKTYDGFIDEDALVRPPKGFSADTPHIDAIKLRHFFAMVEVNVKRRPPKDLASDLGDKFRDLLPLMEWLRAAGSAERRLLNAPDIPYRPILTDAARPSTFTVRAVDEHGEARDTPIAGEHPLTLYVDKREILTLMTLGAAPEALAIGYLRNQRLLELARRDRVGSSRLGRQRSGGQHSARPQGPRREARQADDDQRLRPGHRVRGSDGRNRCGEASRRRGARRAPRCMRCSTGCVGTRRSTSRPAPFTAARSPATKTAASEILYFVEDVGRHNAVDAIAGLMWLDRVDGGDKIFYTTGRLTSEMVIKAAQMGIPFLVSRSGLTQMGYEIAQKVGITMIGRATNKHFLLFAGGERFRPDA